MKTCPKCNAQLADDVVFCNECGARLEAAQPAADSVAPAAPAAPKAPLDPAKVKKYATYGGIGVVALIVIIILCVMIGASGGPKGTVKSYMNAFKSGNAKSMINVMLPKSVASSLIEDQYDCELSEYVDAYSTFYKAAWKGLKSEDKVKVTYSIKACENVNKPKTLKKDLKNYGISDLDDFRDFFERFEDYDFDTDKIKAGYACELKYAVELGGKKPYKGEVILLVYKYGGKFYVYSNSIPNVEDLMRTVARDDKLSDKYEDVLDELDDIADEYDDIIYW